MIANFEVKDLAAGVPHNTVLSSPGRLVQFHVCSTVSAKWQLTADGEPIITRMTSGWVLLPDDLEKADIPLLDRGCNWTWEPSDVEWKKDLRISITNLDHQYPANFYASVEYGECKSRFKSWWR